MISTVDKCETRRRAKAQAKIKMAYTSLEKLQNDELPKKGVLQTARVAGMIAAKKTPELIPHCHSIGVDQVTLDFEFTPESSGQGMVIISAEVETLAKTGVEMEALVAVSMAALTVYDMVKAVDKNMEIIETKLLEKRGGKSQFQKSLFPEISVAVLLTDDCVFSGKKKEKGDTLKKVVTEKFRLFGIENFSFEVLGNDPEPIRKHLLKLCEEEKGLIFTIGGSGLDRHDQTSTVVEGLWDRSLPGVMEAARDFGQRQSPFALLSRGGAGQRQKSILVSLPGSRSGVEESLTAILPGLVHGLNVLRRKPGQ
jgi:molybdenum cofactor biosynthesis protein MoaC